MNTVCIHSFSAKNIKLIIVKHGLALANQRLRFLGWSCLPGIYNNTVIAWIQY